MAQRAAESGLFEPYKPKNADKIDEILIVAPDLSLIPFDYSYFSIVYDSEKIKNPPASLDDLCKSEFARSLILMDPRTSSPGLGFLGWTKEVYGDKWPDYWRRLQPSILTIAEGWSTGYGLFTAGEAPLVLSYTTSPGYHVEYEGTDRIKAAIFPSGQPIQIELAGLLKGASHKENAKKFLDFMVSPSFQSAIPLGNWMYPVIDIPLPASFAANPQPPLSLYPLALTETDFELWAQLFRK
jgi:thiamine transport system substrate-binding protein